MNNEYFTEIMLQFAKLEAKIDSLEQEIKLLGKVTDFEGTVKPVPAESFSRFLELNTNTGS